MLRSDRGITDLAAIHAIVDEVEKGRGLNQIMKHYSGRDRNLEPARLASTRVWRVDLDELTAKRSVAKG